jgi:hypothetical protein
MAGQARNFISSSSHDTAMADRQTAAVTGAGAAVCIDREPLTPGAPNLEVKVREGIAQATHVVSVASPDAALSCLATDSSGELAVPGRVGLHRRYR